MGYEVDWDAGHYEEHGRFIPQFGIQILPWLQAGPGQRILDLGCGDGYLSEHIAALGPDVVGVDINPEMLAAAQARGIDAREADITNLPFEAEFDAVFSNSVLQWVSDPVAAVSGVARALKPGGRFVVDIGGLGNLAALLTAVKAVGEMEGGDPALCNPFYSPTAAQLQTLLEDAGFTLERMELETRLTPMPEHLWQWVSKIFDGFFNQFDEPTRKRAGERVMSLLEPVLCDGEGRWFADHAHLQASARL